MKTFDLLVQELLEIRQTRPEGSRSVELWDQGVHAIGKKIVEEAAEVWMAAEYQGRDELATEISQLLYHLGVLMVEAGVSPEDVYRAL